MFVAWLIETTSPSLLEKARQILLKSGHGVDDCGIQLRWMPGAPAFTTLVVDDPEGDQGVPTLWGEDVGADIARGLGVRVWEFLVGDVSITTAWSETGIERWQSHSLRRAEKEAGVRRGHLFGEIGGADAFSTATVGESWGKAVEALQRRRDIVLANEPPTTEAELARIRVKASPGKMLFVDGDGNIAQMPVTYDRYKAFKFRPTVVATTNIRFEAGYEYSVGFDGTVQRRQTVWGFLEAEKKPKASTKKAPTKKAPTKKAPTRTNKT